MRTLSFLFLIAIVCTPAIGRAGESSPAEAPVDAQSEAPDPSRGERFDGRPSDPAAKRRKAALAVPRFLLVLPRLLWRVIFIPIGIAVRQGERHHILQKALAAITSRDGLVGVRPVVNIVSGIQPIFGLTYYNLRALGPRTELHATLAGNIADAIMARFFLRPTPFSGGAQYMLDLDYSFRDDYVFSGIGFAPAQAGRVGRYAMHSFELRNVVRLNVHPLLSFYADGIFGLRRYANGISVYGDPPIFDVYCGVSFEGRCLTPGVLDALVPGFNEGTQFIRAGVGMRVDTRDSISQPTSGVALDLHADYSHGLGDDASSYFRVHGVLEGVLDLWKRSRVLVLRLQAGMVLPMGTAPVPFSELFFLGHPDVHRGIRFGRFIDSSMFLATAEYRWPVWIWMDAALFVDYGGVFGPRFQGFAFDRMIPAVGGALRIRTTQHVFMRFQLAYGWGEGVVFTFTASAF